jgi:hypothetical protein
MMGEDLHVGLFQLAQDGMEIALPARKIAFMGECLRTVARGKDARAAVSEDLQGVSTERRSDQALPQSISAAFPKCVCASKFLGTGVKFGANAPKSEDSSPPPRLPVTDRRGGYLAVLEECKDIPTLPRLETGLRLETGESVRGRVARSESVSL